MSSNKALCAVALSALVTATAACTTEVQVVGGGSGGGGAQGIGGTGNTGGAGQGGGAGAGGSMSGDGTAIAMLYSQIPPIGAGGGTSSSGSGTGGPDPNAISVFISNFDQQCGDPFASPTDCPTVYWQVTFDIPPAMQVGGTYSLQDLDASASDSGPNGSDPLDCWGGGGTFWDGQARITEIDATHVAGTLVGTDTLEFNANAPFSAKRCFQ